MRKVTCHECKKRYDYDEDGFCPACGAFNSPSSSSCIDGEERNDQADWKSTVQLEQPEDEVDQLWGKLQQSFQASNFRKWHGRSLMAQISGRQIRQLGVKQLILLVLGFIILLNVLSLAF